MGVLAEYMSIKSCIGNLPDRTPFHVQFAGFLFLRELSSLPSALLAKLGASIKTFDSACRLWRDVLEESRSSYLHFIWLIN